MPSTRILSLTGAGVAAALMLFSAGNARATAVPDPQVFIEISDASGLLGVYNTSAGTAGNISGSNIIFGSGTNSVTLNNISVTEINSGSEESLNFNLNTLINNTGESLTITAIASGNNFIGPASGFSMSSDILTNFAEGGTASWAWYSDPANTLGASATGDTPGVEVGSTTPLTTSGGQGTYGGDDLYAFSPAGGDTDLFSMTEYMSYVLPNQGVLENLGMVVDVPEPGSLLLLGTALLGIGLARRFKGTAGGSGTPMAV